MSWATHTHEQIVRIVSPAYFSSFFPGLVTARRYSFLFFLLTPWLWLIGDYNPRKNRSSGTSSLCVSSIVLCNFLSWEREAGLTIFYLFVLQTSFWSLFEVAGLLYWRYFRDSLLVLLFILTFWLLSYLLAMIKGSDFFQLFIETLFLYFWFFSTLSFS